MRITTTRETLCLQWVRETKSTPFIILYGLTSRQARPTRPRLDQTLWDSELTIMAWKIMAMPGVNRD